jgi:DNA-binding PadR family transcriptional regulator
MKSPKTSDKFWIVDRLQEIKEDRQRQISYHLLRRLEEKGLIAPVARKITPGRGKPRKFYELSPKGRSWLALSKTWKRPATIPSDPPAAITSEAASSIAA